jgi:hypothetical protein
MVFDGNFFGNRTMLKAKNDEIHFIIGVVGVGVFGWMQV